MSISNNTLREIGLRIRPLLLYSIEWMKAMLRFSVCHLPNEMISIFESQTKTYLKLNATKKIASRISVWQWWKTTISYMKNVVNAHDLNKCYFFFSIKFPSGWWALPFIFNFPWKMRHTALTVFLDIRKCYANISISVALRFKRSYKLNVTLNDLHNSRQSRLEDREKTNRFSF